MDSLPEQPTRRRIVEFLSHHPGSSGREIQRGLKLGWGETAYHLEQLVGVGAIDRDRGARRDYYFPRNFSFLDRRLLMAFQSPVERQILVELARIPDSSFVELATRLDAPKSTVAFHLKFLIARELVTIGATGGIRRYSARNPGRVLELSRLYVAGPTAKWVEGFTETFGGLVRD
jgi:predicted transcriptional regulator